MRFRLYLENDQGDIEHLGNVKTQFAADFIIRRARELNPSFDYWWEVDYDDEM